MCKNGDNGGMIALSSPLPPAITIKTTKTVVWRTGGQAAMKEINSDLSVISTPVI